METLQYKRNIDDTIDRLRLFLEDRVQDRIFAMFDVPVRALEEYNSTHPEGYCTYPDPAERTAFWDAYLRERSAVDDDSVPSAYLSEFDQGLYGGLLGGEVQFMCHDNGWISSMVAPILSDWSEFEGLHFDESHPWFEKYLRQLRIFVDGAAGKFGISHFILIDGLNFVFELVGATKTYESLLERPELVRRAVDFAYDLNVKVQETFFEHVPGFRGGTFSNMVQWIPGKIVSESVDPFHMTSPDYFEIWGRDNIERMFARFDGGVLHIHGNGRHLLDSVKTLRGLKAIWLGDDTGYPKAFEMLHEIKRHTADIPLVVTADYPGFTRKLERNELPGGVFYWVMNTPDVDTANRCMDRVRAYRV